MMNNREYELSTLINFLQYDIAKLKKELESKYREGYMDGKAFKDRHITIRDHFAGLAMQGLVGKPSWDLEQFKQDPKRIAVWSYDIADAMLEERNKEECSTLLDK